MASNNKRTFSEYLSAPVTDVHIVNDPLVKKPRLYNLDNEEDVSTICRTIAAQVLNKLGEYTPCNDTVSLRNSIIGYGYEKLLTEVKNSNLSSSYIVVITRKDGTYYTSDKFSQREDAITYCLKEMSQLTGIVVTEDLALESLGFHTIYKVGKISGRVSKIAK